MLGICFGLLWMFFFFVFTTPFVCKMNHFGCLKLANCPQFGLLFASIASRIAFVCLAIQQVGATKVENNLLSNLTFAADQFYGLPWVESRIPTANISRFSRGSEAQRHGCCVDFRGTPVAILAVQQYNSFLGLISLCTDDHCSDETDGSQALLHPQT